MATEPGVRGCRHHGMDPRVRAGVLRRRRTNGALPDASDPLGRTWTAGSIQSVPTYIIRDRVCHSFCRYRGFGAELDRPRPRLARSAQKPSVRQDVRVGREPAARAAATPRVPSSVCTGKLLRPRIVQTERDQTGPLGGRQVTHRQHRLGQVLHRLGRKGVRNELRCTGSADRRAKDPTQFTAMLASSTSAATPWVKRCNAAFIEA